MFGYSNLITVGVETFAAIDRHLTKKKILELATNRYNEHKKNNSKKSFIKVGSPLQLNELKKLKNDSCVVFVDCALELCDTEEHLKEFWNELKRVSGSNNVICKDLFVFHIQHWSSTRLFLEPKVRWIILEAPPKVGANKLKYKSYGKRNTVLSDVRKRDKK